MFLAQGFTGFYPDSTAVSGWLGSMLPGIDPEIQAVIAGLAAAWAVVLLGKVFGWLNPKISSGKGFVFNILGVVTGLWTQYRWILNPLLAALFGKLTGGSFVVGMLGYGAHKTLAKAGEGVKLMIKKDPEAMRRGGVAIIFGVLLASMLMFSTSFAATGKTAAADSSKTSFTASLLAFPMSLLKDNVYSVGAGERWDDLGVLDFGDWQPTGIGVARITHVFSNHINCQIEYEQAFKRDNPNKAFRALGIIYF
jgi:hypothetical protein